MSAKSMIWLAAGLFATTAVRADERPSENVRKLVEGYREAAARINGTQLKLTAVDWKGEPDPVDIGPIGPRLGLHWEIDYNGPRFPLTIRKPSLGAYGQSSVMVFLIGADGKYYIVPIHARGPVLYGPWASGKADFVTVTPKRAAKGTVTVSWAAVLHAAQEKWPEQFGKARPVSAYVQLRHSPSDRAEHLGLDAWTGSLQTELVPVPLRELGIK